jgi:plasmid stabilization system protein ParE
MSRRVILRPQVPDDMRDIIARLEQSSLAVADRFAESVFAAFDDLAVMPGMGSPKHFRLPRLTGLRSWAVPGFPNHLIYYLTTDEAIIIYGVLHGARNIPAVLKDRLP